MGEQESFKQLTPMKDKIFRSILFFVPFVFLLSLEVILRITQYGGDLRIVTTVERNGKKFYTMNQLVGKRYFRGSKLYFHKGSHDFFEVQKSPNTVRVFCMGESTTAGFPYEYQAAPSELLRDRLIRALPNKNLEVINTAIAAINSFTVLEFVKELVRYQPDLFVIYIGQNEFYGVYGVGSTISVGKNRWFIRTYLWLQQFKTFLLIRDAVSLFFSLIGLRKEGAENATLMEQMVQNSTIMYGDNEYQIAKKSFEENYTEIVDVAKDNDIPLVLSTIVTNEKDLLPFVSLHRKTLPDSLRRVWEKLFTEGLAAEQDGKCKLAIERYLNAIAIDSVPAKVHFRLGKCYEALGNDEKARVQYSMAKDLDGLRFRAPSEFNNFIRQLSKQNHLPLADVEGAFREYSPHGILGNELLWEHVHPKLEGYFLMVKTLFRTIQSHHLLASKEEWTNVREAPDSVYWEMSSITDLDRGIGALKIAELTYRWPFRSEDKPLNFKPKTIAEEAAFRYAVKKEISWAEAHLYSAEEFKRLHEWQKALQEYKAMEKVEANNPYILTMMGDMLVQLNSPQEAEQRFLQAMRLNDNQYLRLRLGILKLLQQKPGEALEHLKQCLEIDEFAIKKFQPSEREDAQYYLGLANVRNGNILEARRVLNLLLKNNPFSAKAEMLLREINR